MSVTVKELVRDQILAEAPGMEGVPQAERYIDRTLAEMGNNELLERISDAIQHGVRVQWLYNRSGK